MNTASRLVVDYTRVSDDAAILCKRRDFPRAVNVLQRRAPDRRRWRAAFRTVSSAADKTLDGPRRNWFEAALREVVSGVGDRGLQGELALDVAAADGRFDLGEVLPRWSARDLWRIADAVYLPMEYLTRVTHLPRSIDASIDTARVVVDFRRTAEAHRSLALELGAAVPATAYIEEASGNCSEGLLRTIEEVRAQQDAARRWRELAHRLMISRG